MVKMLKHPYDTRHSQIASYLMLTLISVLINVLSVKKYCAALSDFIEEKRTFKICLKRRHKLVRHFHSDCIFVQAQAK